MTAAPTPPGGRTTDDMFGYLLALADDALVLSHRCGQWVARAPQLEEDVALANIGLDLLGQARALLTHAGDVEGRGRDEDSLAYLRPAGEYRNAVVCELPNGDFAASTARLLAVAAYQLELYRALQRSRDDAVAGVATKAVKEVAYHLDHASQWVLRLGDGTQLSRRRMQAGIDVVLPCAEGLFDTSWLAPGLVRDGIAVDPAALRPEWVAHVDAVLDEVGLTRPATGQGVLDGGRRGRHTPALVDMLEEMQALHRSHPGAGW